MRIFSALRPSAAACAPSSIVGNAFWDPHGMARIVAMLTICAGLLDAASTEIGLRYAGAYETNPLIRTLRGDDNVAWIIIKMAGHGLIAYAAVRRPTLVGAALLGAVAMVTISIAANNYLIFVEAMRSLVRAAAM